MGEPRSCDVQVVAATAPECAERVVRILLQEGACVDCADDDGQTALMAAAAEGLTSVVQLLLDAGADWHATHEASSETYPAWLHVLPHGRDGATALSLAREHGHENTAAVLERWIMHHGDTREQSQLRGYQLRSAASQGDGERVCAILKDAGQGQTNFVDAPDEDGRTALWLAAWNNCAEVVSALRSLDLVAIFSPQFCECFLNVALCSSHVTWWADGRAGSVTLCRGRLDKARLREQNGGNICKRVRDRRGSGNACCLGRFGATRCIAGCGEDI